MEAPSAKQRYHQSPSKYNTVYSGTWECKYLGIELVSSFTSSSETSALLQNYHKIQSQVQYFGFGLTA